MRSEKLRVEPKSIWILQELTIFDPMTFIPDRVETFAFTNLTKIWKVLKWKDDLQYSLFLNKELSVLRSVNSYSTFYRYMTAPHRPGKKFLFHQKDKPKNTLTIFKVQLNTYS